MSFYLLPFDSYITVDGHMCSLLVAAPDGNKRTEFAYITIPPLNAYGCYSISLMMGNGHNFYAGFGINDCLSRADNEKWSSAYYSGGTSGYGNIHGHPSASGLGVCVNNIYNREGNYILTLNYNPKAGTLHGSRDLEPSILLRRDIPAGKQCPYNLLLECLKQAHP